MKKNLLLLAFLSIILGLSAQNPGEDKTVYTDIEGMHLTTLWNFSRINGKTFVPNSAYSTCRGMVVFNDKIYFPKRDGENNPSLLEYNTTDGSFIKEISLPVDMKFDLTCNDIQVDNAGHLIVGGMIFNVSDNPLELWNVNPETGDAVKCFSAKSEGFEGISTGARIDCFAVYGDITKNGIVAAALSGTDDKPNDYFVYWIIKDGVVGEGNTVQIQEYVPATPNGNGSCPRIKIVSDEYFYLDGFNSVASLYDFEGNYVDGFYKETNGKFAMNPSINDTIMPINWGNNGVTEFSYKGKNYIVYIYSNNEVANPQRWAICELGENSSFEGMKMLFRVPDKGMGAASNGVRTAIPQAVVKEDGVYIYTYAQNNGLAAFKMTTVESSAKSISKTDAKILIAGNEIYAKGAKWIELYSIDGKKLIKVIGDKYIVPETKGIFIAKAFVQNKPIVEKIIIK